MTTSNNPPLKIYCENIVGIIFLFLTQYKFKIFFFLFPPFTYHSTGAHHVWIRTSTLPFIYLFILFPQGFHFPRFNLHHTFKKKISTPSQPLTSLHIFPFFRLLNLHFFRHSNFPEHVIVSSKECLYLCCRIFTLHPLRSLSYS